MSEQEAQADEELVEEVVEEQETDLVEELDTAPEEKEEASHEIEIMEVREWIQPLEVEMELDGVHLLEVERQGELCGTCDEHEGENLSFAGLGCGQSAFSVEV